ncbi:oligoendopeptidase F [Clostridium sp. MCC353]|uniref:oligoendopeptidase F n=1 Tax=Clostridium sp. MCC353 TaxID=2592646 RepID=UPI001C00B43F|nr:oligoendopeptidase F [Clostridium sp. MCC353]MBT9779148.1 oligoendopeptidase F [Clostridium sp. MCC353]
MKKREEIPVEFTWKMEDMFSDDREWESLYKETEAQLERYEEFKGHLADSAKTLYECLKLDDELSLKLERIFVYAKQKSDQDTANPLYQDYTSRAQSLSYKAAALSSYIVPEILSMDEGLLKEYMESGNGLEHFKRAVDLLMPKKQHTLSPEMEALLADSYEATQSPSQIFGMFNNADLRFPVIKDADGNEVQITHGNYISLMESSDRRVRKDAFQALYGCYKQFSNTLAATYSANVKQAIFYAKAKNYSSSRAHVLAENEIPEEVYDNLIKAVRRFLPALHRYVGIRKKVMGLDEIHMYDIYAPMVSDVKKTVSFEEAKEMAEAGLTPLGGRYLELLREGFDNRWIDVYENEGKRSGAYSWGAYGSHPYVLLNYNDTLDYVFTLVHEMGHALHSWHSDHSQPYTYAGYKIFVAEVASTCNEALLIRHLLGCSKDKKEKKYLINHFLESFRTTLFRQAMFAEFEAMTHKMAEEGKSLTAQTLCGLYHQLNVDYFGPDMVVDPEIDYEWSRIPHFYTPFYVYQYATGFSAAIAISTKILSGDQETINGYFKFLSGGNSMSPIDLLRLCGVDMSSPEPVEEALKVFESLLEEFEQENEDEPI